MALIMQLAVTKLSVLSSFSIMHPRRHSANQRRADGRNIYTTTTLDKDTSG